MRRSVITLVVLLFSSRLYAQSPQASITITRPATGEAVVANHTVTVEATSEGDLAWPVYYEFSNDGGATWHVDWQDSSSGKGYVQATQVGVGQKLGPAQIRIRDGNGVIGLSGVFRVIAKPAITSLTVNHGKYPVPVNSDVLIEWTVEGETPRFDIDWTRAGAFFEIEFQLDSTRRSTIWHTPEEAMGGVYVQIGAVGLTPKIVGPFEINTFNAVDETQDAAAISVHPNPVSNMLNVTLREPQPATITLLDLLGREVLSTSTEVKNAFLDVTSLPRGTYLVRIATTSGEHYSRPVLVR